MIMVLVGGVRGAGQASVPIWIFKRRKTELKEDRNMPDNNTKH
jgi:hypothetical protein